MIDLSGVGYIDSATIGCLMDLYRQMNAAGGAVRLIGVQKRVETMLTMTGALNFLAGPPRRGRGAGQLRRRRMKTIRTSRGTGIPLDNDLLAVIEALYHDVTVQLDLDRSFDDMMKEIRDLVDQMTDAERAEYLVESLFLNTVTYENERLGALIRKLPNGSADGPNADRS